MQAQALSVEGQAEASKWPELTLQEVCRLLSEIFTVEREGSWGGEPRNIRRMFEGVLAQLHGAPMSLKGDPMKPLPTDLNPTAMPRCSCCKAEAFAS